MSAAAKVIDRLNRVKATRPGQWIAACPCCESRKGRPLSVREAQDGRVLIHAFCGCETVDVLGRLGLELADLFDQPSAPNVKPIYTKVPAADVLEALSQEVTVLAVIANDLLEKRQINETDWERLAKAAERIGKAANYIHERGA